MMTDDQIRQLAAQADSMSLLNWWFKSISEDQPETRTCRIVREVITSRVAE